MKSLAIYILFVFFSQPKFITGKQYQGYIFSKDYENRYFMRTTHQRFTPTKQDIILAESNIQQKAKSLRGNSSLNQKKCWNYKKIHQYNRQYFGEYDENGNKIILVNFVFKKSTPSYCDSEVVILLDDKCFVVWQDKILID